MQDVVPISPTHGQSGGRWVLSRFLEYLPRGNMLDEKAWRRRHRLLKVVLILHFPSLVLLGLFLGNSSATIAQAVAPAVVCLVLGHLVTHHRLASFFVTGGLVFCSTALVLLTSGSIEAHFHFFIIIGFIALYQDWVPFLWNVAFTVLSHGIGTIWLGGGIFNHPAAQQHPWIWSFVHGVAVLFACVGVVIFWRVTEDEQTEKEALGRQLITADAEINRRQFTSDMLVNLARRNQSMLYRQLDIINQLEDKERDPDALADLFKLDHLATRVRRNAESLLVLAGEQAPRTWSAPVALRDVVRAAIAETEDLDRVVFAVDDRVAVAGGSVADLTHLLAELTENAVRFSPPETAVTIRARPNRRDEGGQLLTVEDWGVGMPPDDLDEANDLLAHPREVDLAVSQRLGFHVVARLASRHGITVSLSTTPGSGITAVVVLPAALFTRAVVADPALPPPALDPDGPRPYVSGPIARPAVHDDREPGRPDAVPAGETAVTRTGAGRPTRSGNWATPEPFATSVPGDAGPMGPDGRWRGWWNPEVHGADSGFGAAGRPGGLDVVGTGVGSNGNGANGHGPNGHGSNGNGNDHGPNGSSSNGSGSNGNGSNGNGRGSNGLGLNGVGSNGHGLNGFGSNGHGTDGSRRNGDGHGPHGNGSTESGRTGPRILREGRGGGRSGSTGPRRDPLGVDGLDEHRAPGPDADGRDAGSFPADGLLNDGLLNNGPNRNGPRNDGIGNGSDADVLSLPGPAGPREPAAPVDGSAIPDARQELSPFGSPDRRPGSGFGGVGGVSTGPRAFPAVPTAMTPPALPYPRADQPAATEQPTGGPSLGNGRGRSLRRRVPQSHLAPELRHLTHGGLAETAAPLSADAAASALSRYQASRQAAQAVVETPGESPSAEEGERA